MDEYNVIDKETEEILFTCKNGDHAYNEAKSYVEDYHKTVIVEGYGGYPVTTLEKYEVSWDDANGIEKDSKIYFWLETEYLYGDYSTPKFALHRGFYDDDDNKDRDTEEIILWASYEDAGVENPDLNDSINPDEEMQNIDQLIEDYIGRELGFVPDYEYN